MPMIENPIKFVYVGTIDNTVPAIKDVKAINNKVVIVYFVDGTKAKAVCDKDDVFSLEQGIGVCITKRLLNRDEQKGSSAYNKAIRNAVKVMKRNEELEQAKKEQEAEEKRIKEKIARKKAKRAQSRAERRIKEMTTAILLADRKKEEAFKELKTN